MIKVVLLELKDVVHGRQADIVAPCFGGHPCVYIVDFESSESGFSILRENLQFLPLGQLCGVEKDSLDSSGENLLSSVRSGFRGPIVNDVLKAFSCKLWWRLRCNDSIWVDYMHAKYVKINHLLPVEVDRSPASWRRLLEVRELAEGNICWCLGKGLMNFWHNRWCFEFPFS